MEKLINVFVHKYKTTHMKKRKIMRRARKDGIAILDHCCKDGFHYKITEENLNKLRKW